MEFTKVPTKCWVNSAKCAEQPTLRVPEQYGDPLVTLTIFSPVTVANSFQPSSTLSVRAIDGEVEFSNVGFLIDGDLILKATADGVTCPAISKSFFVDNADLHTLFRFQSGFPSDGPFWIVQPRKSCTNIVVLMIILAVVAIVIAFKLVFSALFFDVKKVVLLGVVIGVIGAFSRDYGIAYDHWQCNDHFTSSFKFTLS